MHRGHPWSEASGGVLMSHDDELCRCGAGGDCCLMLMSMLIWATAQIGYEANLVTQAKCDFNSGGDIAVGE